MKPAILVVDDEPNILKALERLLRREGYQVQTAGGGTDALEALDSQDFAAVICDHQMPGMGGIEVLAQALERRPDTYRIILTGQADLDVAQASINEAQVQCFLLKPWNDDLLRAALRRGLEEHRLRQEHRRLTELTGQQKLELERANQRLEAEVRARTEELQSQNAELKRLRRKLEGALRDTVNVLVSLIEAHSPSVGLHAKRVAEYARSLAEQVNVPESNIQDIEFAALLHDIGSLAKRHQPGRGAAPTRGEHHDQHQHHHHHDTEAFRLAESSATILGHVTGFEVVADAVLHLHEHYDGSGQPDGAREDEIPLAARIIAIANAFEEATHNPADPTHISYDTGRKLLLADRGRRFDPALVQTFLALLDARAGHTYREAEVELSPQQLSAGMTLARAVHNVEGLLLVKPGTELTSELIERIRKLSAQDPMLNSVFVRGVPDQPAPAPAAIATQPAPAVAPASAAAAAPPRQRNGEQIHALIVDDDRSVCRALARELRRAGITSRTVNDGRAAQELLEDHSFDIVLIDVAMPVMTGDLLVAHIQQCWPDQPCIILTGHATRKQILRIAQASNVARIMAKPWDPEDLLATIHQALGKPAPTGSDKEALV